MPYAAGKTPVTETVKESLMYMPSQFEETRADVLHELIRAHPLSTLVTLAGGGLEANHIPLQLVPDAMPHGVLRGHVARANGMWKSLRPDTESLAIFQGSQTYISPSWYPTKQETGKVVPTWNYAVVHVYGTLRAIDDPDWLRAQLEALTAHNEAAFPRPWSVGDAPDDYVRTLIGAIVGIELSITRVVGKWKVSQNQPRANREGVAAGLRQSAHGRDAAAVMADLVVPPADK